MGVDEGPDKDAPLVAGANLPVVHVGPSGMSVPAVQAGTPPTTVALVHVATPLGASLPVLHAASPLVQEFTAWVLVTITDKGGFHEGKLHGAIQSLFPTQAGSVPTWSEICARNGLLSLGQLASLTPRFYAETDEFWIAIQDTQASDKGYLYIGLRKSREPREVCRETLDCISEVVGAYRRNRDTSAVAWTADLFLADSKVDVRAEKTPFLGALKTAVLSGENSEKGMSIGVGLVSAFATGIAVNPVTGFIVLIAAGLCSFAGFSLQSALRERKPRWRLEGWSKR